MLPRGRSDISESWPNAVSTLIASTSKPAIADAGLASPSEVSIGHRSEPNRSESTQAAPLNLATRTSDVPVTPVRSTAAPSLIAASKSSWDSVALPIVERRSVFEQLKETIAQCRLCQELASTRTQTVFGVGSLQPRVVFFGEAPGADEDRIGEPFVGAAGQLLDKIIAASKMKREEVYILNSIKCRPPRNRTPSDQEMANCRGFFERQLDVLQPEFIVCLGAVAARSVLQSTSSIGMLRGRFYSFKGAQVMVTYHPAYLLRNPDAKKLVWDDMQMLMRSLGLM